MPETITVILPVNRWHDNTDGAIESVLDQRGVDVLLLLITNGHDRRTIESADLLARSSSTISVQHCETESLPAALNLGLRSCQSELVARMDADDYSHPNRLARQAAYMHINPKLAGCGCGADFIATDSRRNHLVLPPLSAQQARWKLLISNVFVHGSMMLRRSRVLESGGYNESLSRAQDYDLWLRLAQHGLGGVQEVLYTYTMPEHGDPSSLDQEQAQVSARLLLDAWEELPNGEPDELPGLMARLLKNDTSARVQLESVMERDGPTRETIQAWMWSCRQHPIPATIHSDREIRIRAAGEMLIEARVSEVWLWGAGDLARVIVGSDLLGVPIAGFADDARAGERLAGKAVRNPSELPADATLLIASDLYEDLIWERSAPLRAKGQRVMRMPQA